MKLMNVLMNATDEEEGSVEDLWKKETDPKSPKMKEYPFTIFGWQRRSVQHKWFEMLSGSSIL